MRGIGSADSVVLNRYFVLEREGKSERKAEEEQH